VAAANRRDLSWLVGVIGANVAIMFVLLKLWEANIHIPFEYGGDSNVTLMYIKDVIEHFWYDTNSHLAAPFGQELYDYPAFAGDNLQLLIIKALSLGSTNPPTVMNVFYLLTYPLDTFTAFLVLRSLGISRPATAVGALLFAFLPFHFYRSETHLFFSAYYAIPLGVYLILTTMRGGSLFARREHPGPLSWLSRRTAFTLVLCAIIGSASEYYATFTVIILLLGAVLCALRDRHAARLLTAIALSAAIGLTLFVNYSPSFVYQRIHGGDSQTTERQPAESEEYSFRLIQLLLPGSFERIPALASKDLEYDEISPLPNNFENVGVTLGIVGAVGFVWLLIVAGMNAVGAVSARSAALVNPLIRDSSVAAVIAFLIGTAGGISALIAYLVTPQIRAWARISPFLSFFAMIAIGVLLDGLVRLGRRRGWHPLVAMGTMLVVLAVGLFDQSGPTLIPPYTVAKSKYLSDAAYVGQVQHSLPRGAMVFQLPYEPFPPIVPTSSAAQYENVRPYLHSTTLRWSYGSVSGRAANWQASVVNQPLSVVLPAVVAAGFQGIQIEHGAYPDGGHDIEAVLSGLPESDEITSPEGIFSFFNLQGYARSMRASTSASEISTLRQATLYPLSMVFASGFYETEPGAGSPRWARQRDVITVENPSRVAQRGEFTTTLFTGYATRSRVVVQWPEGAHTVVEVSSYGYKITRMVSFPPGQSRISVFTNAPRVQTVDDPRILNIHFLDTDLMPEAYLPFLGHSSATGIATEPAGELP
jgi:hypothetical protein